MRIADLPPAVRLDLLIEGLSKHTQEDPFLSDVIQIARLKWWTVAHFRPGLTKSGRWVTAVQGDGAGFTDLVLARERLIYVELKSPKGVLSPAQRYWRDVLKKAGAEWYLWRPKDAAEIIEVLT